MSDHSTGTQLALKIIDLEYPEKEYTGFQVGIENISLIDIPLKGSQLPETAEIIIDNLIPETVYKIRARVRHTDTWSEVAGVAFITQVKPPNLHGGNKPVDRFVGGAM